MAVTLPDTQQYRVTALGARYNEPELGYDPNTGDERVVFVSKLATRGQKINLVEGQAKRLLGLGVIADVDAPLTYDEMSDDQLATESNRRGLTLRGQGLNGEPIREDYINALNNSDRGAVIAASDPSGVVSVTSQADVSSGSGGQVPIAEGGQSSQYDVQALSEQIKGGDGKALTVDETVALAGDDPAAARAVLEAESVANGGDPRKGVTDKLQPIADRA